VKSEIWLGHAMSSNFPCLQGGNVAVFPESNEVFIFGRNVHVTRTHLKFLTALLSNFCKTVSYERIMHVEGRQLTHAEQNLLKVQMFHLRRVLKRHKAGLEIRNVYGQGYQIRPT
jgi:DNA-binding response OmpR family regulator